MPEKHCIFCESYKSFGPDTGMHNLYLHCIDHHLYDPSPIQIPEITWYANVWCGVQPNILKKYPKANRFYPGA